MRKIKKLISIILSAVLMLSIIPASAGAFEPMHPTDIVLVLDQSGSMCQRFDKNTTREQAMKNSVNSFLDNIALLTGPDFVNRVSIVTFGTAAYTIAGWTDADASGIEYLHNKINKLSTPIIGETYMDLGLDRAATLLNARKESSGRNSMVVLFTDGYPGTTKALGNYFSSLYNTPNEADDAVLAASKLKRAGAKVYTIGIFDGADPAAAYKTTLKKKLLVNTWSTADACANGLMHFISSDYEASYTSWRNNTTNNDGRNNGYFFAANDNASLNEAFNKVLSSHLSDVDMLQLMERINYSNMDALKQLYSLWFGEDFFYETLWPTIGSLCSLNDRFYMLDYNYDYDIDDLISKGAGTAYDIIKYAADNIFDGRYTPGLGEYTGGCSVFDAVDDNGNYVMGRNFDYLDSTALMVWTHPEGRHASVSTTDGLYMLITEDLAPESLLGRLQLMLSAFAPVDGINDAGLSMAVLALEDAGVHQQTEKPDVFVSAAVRACLDKAANVDEALAILNSMDLCDYFAPGFDIGYAYHYIISDATGRTVLVEYLDGEMNVIERDAFDDKNMFMTNFYIADYDGNDPESYWPFGEERYNIMKETLEEKSGVLSFDDSFELLSKVHVNVNADQFFTSDVTIWSNLFNNTEKKVSIASYMDYSKIYTFSPLKPLTILSLDSVNVTTPFEGIVPD